MSHSTVIKAVPISSKSALQSTVDELVQNGVKAELRENCKPRMYYTDQIKKQIQGSTGAKDFDLNEDPDVCDMVIHFPDSYYDIGLLRNSDGSGYMPIFDDYTGKATTGDTQGSQGLGAIIGSKFNSKNGTKQQHTIGQFSQLYSKHAAIEAATEQGYMIAGTSFDEETGEVQLEIMVD